MPEILTSLDIVNQSFKKSLRGYDSTEVDEFLDSVAETLQIHAQKTKEMEEELKQTKSKLNEYEDMKDVLHEALISAQKSAEEKVTKAEEKANELIENAKIQADEICKDAAKEADRLRDGVYQIKKIRKMYEEDFRGMLVKFDSMLNRLSSDKTLNEAVGSVLETYEENEQTEEKNLEEKDLTNAYAMLGVNPEELETK
ncbi:MAG: DivIVA domain-containing protein [Synergistaceae bacterium]